MLNAIHDNKQLYLLDSVTIVCQKNCPHIHKLLVLTVSIKKYAYIKASATQEFRTRPYPKQHWQIVAQLVIWFSLRILNTSSNDTSTADSLFISILTNWILRNIGMTETKHSNAVNSTHDIDKFRIVRSITSQLLFHTIKDWSKVRS